jgi:transposase
VTNEKLPWTEEGEEQVVKGSEPKQEAMIAREAGKPAKPRLKAIDRQQIIMRTIDVERLVEPDHEVRAIWEMTQRLDLTGYYSQIRVFEESAGRPATDPRLLVSLWIYACSKGVSSAREIERLCEWDPAYQWLTGMKPVNYHTLSSFRSGNKEVLDNLFIQLLGVLSAEGLITLEQVTQDGTKVKACAGKDTFRREARIREHLQAAREQVERMGDPSVAEEVGPRIAKAQQRAARERQQKLELALEELEKIQAEKPHVEKEEVRVSETDPECRVMKNSEGGYAPSYNLQLSADRTADVIVALDVTQSYVDFDELEGGVERVEQCTGQLPKQLLVDAGFVTRHNIIEMEERGIDLIGEMSVGKTKGPSSLKATGVSERFFPEAFIYNETSNTYTCPAEKIMKRIRTSKRDGFKEHQYQTSRGVCLVCPFKQQCCPNSTNGRTINRIEDDPRVIAFKEKMKTPEAKDIYRLRSQLAEFPIAWIKEKIGLRRFKLRGLTKVRMEATWACLTYNIQQWIRLRWRQPWCETLTS